MDKTGSTTRYYIAKVAATNAAVQTWNPQANALVYEITLNGTDVMIGGNFTFLKFANRNYLGSINKVSGIPDAWSPNADYIVYGLSYNSTRLYAVGAFDNVGGQSRPGAAAFMLSNLNLDSWNPQLSFNGTSSSADLRTVLADDNNVHLGGNFDLVGASPTKYIVTVNPTTAAAKP